MSLPIPPLIQPPADATLALLGAPETLEARSRALLDQRTARNPVREKDSRGPLDEEDANRVSDEEVSVGSVPVFFSINGMPSPLAHLRLRASGQLAATQGMAQAVRRLPTVSSEQQGADLPAMQHVRRTGARHSGVVAAHAAVLRTDGHARATRTVPSSSVESNVDPARSPRPSDGSLLLAEAASAQAVPASVALAVAVDAPADALAPAPAPSPAAGDAAAIVQPDGFPAAPASPQRREATSGMTRQPAPLDASAGNPTDDDAAWRSAAATPTASHDNADADAAISVQPDTGAERAPPRPGASTVLQPRTQHAGTPAMNPPQSAALAGGTAPSPVTVTIPFQRAGQDHQVTASWAPNAAPHPGDQVITFRTSTPWVTDTLQTALQRDGAPGDGLWRVEQADATDDRRPRRPATAQPTDDDA